MNCLREVLDQPDRRADGVAGEKMLIHCSLGCRNATVFEETENEWGVTALSASLSRNCKDPETVIITVILPPSNQARRLRHCAAKSPVLPNVTALTRESECAGACGVKMMIRLTVEALGFVARPIWGLPVAGAGQAQPDSPVDQ